MEHLDALASFTPSGQGIPSLPWLSALAPQFRPSSRLTLGSTPTICRLVNRFVFPRSIIRHPLRGCFFTDGYFECLISFVRMRFSENTLLKTRFWRSLGFVSFIRVW